MSSKNIAQVPSPVDLKAVCYRAGGVAVLAVTAANVVLHPGFALPLLFGAVAALFVIGRADLGVWLIVVLTPIETFGFLSFTMTKAVKLLLTALVACALHLDSLTGKHPPPKDPYHWPLFLVLISGFFATLLAISPLTSLVGLGSLSIFMLYYAGVRRSRVLVENGPWLLRIMLWSALGATLVCFVQLTQGYGGILGSEEQRVMEAEGAVSTVWPMIERASATFNGPSAAGAFLGMGSIIALARAEVFRKSRGRYVLASLLCLLGVLATFSRGAILGSMSGFVFSSWAMGFLSKRRLALVTVFAVLVLTLVFGTEGTRTYLRLGSDLASVSPSRIDVWQATFVILKRHPIFGIGFYEFRGLSQGIEGTSDTPLHPHNGFLKTLVEQGPVGGFAYLMFIVLFIRTARRGLLAVDSLENKWVLGAIAGVGISLFTQELFDANLTLGGSSAAILFASLLGLQTSLHSQISEHSRSELPTV